MPHGDEFSIFKAPGEAPASSAREPQPGGDATTQPEQSVQNPSQGQTEPHACDDQVRQAGSTSEQGIASQQEAVPVLTEEEEKIMLEKAEALKQEGNTLYGQAKYNEAVEKYADAVDAAPPSASKQRAVYLSNIAACDIALKQYKEAVQACSTAIEEDETFVKAYMRRALAQRELDDLDHALGDAKKVLELDPGNTWATKTVKELEPLVTARNEKLKDEMLGKLKDLGNTILGKFGMSLDSFKADKDPNTGGYSIRYQP